MESSDDLSSVKNNEQRLLRKTVSDVSLEIGKYRELEPCCEVVEYDDGEVKQAECECCGMKEECTTDYITRVKGWHCGKWVCGLCSEAVKERLHKAAPNTTAGGSMQEAMKFQREFCQEFNSTTRINPKLSLTCAMRDIAKKSHDNRSNSNNFPSAVPKIGRSTSCVPKIN